MDIESRPALSAEDTVSPGINGSKRSDVAELPAKIIIDLEGTIQDAGRGVEQLLGYKIEQLKGTRLYDRVYRDDLLDLFRSIVNLTLDRRPEVGLSIRIKTALGAWRAFVGQADALLEGRVITGVMLTLYPFSGIGLG